MELLQPKQFDTLSVNSQSQCYKKGFSSKRQIHQHSSIQQQEHCNMCQEVKQKQKIRQKKRQQYRQSYQRTSRSNSQNNEQELKSELGSIVFKNVSKSRNFYNGSSKDISRILNNRFQTQYNNDYQKAYQKSEMSSKQTSKYDQIRELKEEIERQTLKDRQMEKQSQKDKESDRSYEEVNNRKEIEQNIRKEVFENNRYKNTNQFDNGEHLVSELEQRLIDLLGYENIHKIDFEALLEENHDYVFHILCNLISVKIEQCECYDDSVVRDVCNFQKDHNRKLKIKMRTGYSTNYNQQFRQLDFNNNSVKFPSLINDSRLAQITQHPTTISCKTNSQDEYSRKLLSEMIQKYKYPDNLEQRGPVPQSSNYKNSYLDFHNDHSMIQPIPPVEKQSNLNMKFQGKTQYNKQFIRPEDNQYVYKQKRNIKRTIDMAPFALYAPFLNKTTQNEQNQYVTGFTPYQNIKTEHRDNLEIDKSSQNCQNHFMSEQKQSFKRKQAHYQQKKQKLDKQSLKVLLLDRIRQKRIESQQTET